MALFSRKAQGKNFGIAASNMQPLYPDHAPYMATDKITVGREPVGWMYRDTNERTQGWTFMSGTESQDYMDDPSHIEIYDLNTIANYDPDIIPHLDAPRGAAFERKTLGAQLTPVTDWELPGE